MTYPQPDADNTVKQGLGFFRLNATLSSPGDIYESPQGACAFAIGPDSDIANAVAVYLDLQVPRTAMAQYAFSPARAVVGKVYALNDQTYGPSARPGRVLFYCDDIFDPNYVPSGFDETFEALDLITPVLDVIQYFSPQESLGPARVDRSYSFQEYHPLKRGQFIVMPYYGRRYGCITIQNAMPSTSVDWNIYGLNYGIVDDTDPNANRIHQEIPIGTGTLTNPGDQAQVVIAAGGTKTAAVHTAGAGDVASSAMFDAVVVSIRSPSIDTPLGRVPINVTFSDVPGGA